MVSPFLYFPDARLSTAELTAARLDGHLTEVGDAWMPADAVETRELRAGSLASLLGDALAATHATAAWVHGARPEPPARHSVRRARTTRLHHVIDPRLIYRDALLAEHDRQCIGSVLVTTPVRTLVDLLREPADDDDLASAHAMLRGDPDLHARARDWLAAAGAVPGKRAAARWLRDQEDVTR